MHDAQLNCTHLGSCVKKSLARDNIERVYIVLPQQSSIILLHQPFDATLPVRAPKEYNIPSYIQSSELTGKKAYRSLDRTE